MTIEDFFDAIALHFGPTGEPANLHIYREPENYGGGFRADTRGRVSYGDTVGDAVQAAFDNSTGAPSRHARLHPPLLTSDRTAKNWKAAKRIQYDYRTRDWEPPVDPDFEPSLPGLGGEFEA